MQFDPVSSRILRSAIEVHRTLGPGLLENAYRVCLLRQLDLEGLSVATEVPIGIDYKGVLVPNCYRADLIVERSVLVELKAQERLLPIHEAQVNTYLRHSGLHVGLLMNFNVSKLKHGLRRIVR